jgi:hypothetical protein
MSHLSFPVPVSAHPWPAACPPSLRQDRLPDRIPMAGRDPGESLFMPGTQPLQSRLAGPT